MINTYKAAISGAGDVRVELVDDALTDTLRATELEVHLLVPACTGRLSAGVQATVEWAWAHEVRVIALNDGGAVTEIEGNFLEDGADEIITAPDVNAAIVAELANALPFACLLVVLSDGPDPATAELMRLCHEADVPVFDLANGLMEMDPYDMDDPEEENEPEEEKPVETIQPEGTTSDSEGEWVLVDITEPVPNTPVRAVDEWTLEEMGGLLTGISAHVTEMQTILARIRPELAALASPAVEKTPAPKKGAARMEVSLDGGVTWKPRGRGRLRNDALTRVVE